MKVRCITLFDITKTDISNRRKALDVNFDKNLDKKRNQQSNFETILQIVSMRAQPENISDPAIRSSSKLLWGKKYKNSKIVSEWFFEFEVFQSSVFSDGTDELAKLFLDCEGVPMISNLDESVKLPSTLTVSEDFRNIHFEVVNE
jgi:hypothetical protein